MRLHLSVIFSLTLYACSEGDLSILSNLPSGGASTPCTDPNITDPTDPNCQPPTPGLPDISTPVNTPPIYQGFEHPTANGGKWSLTGKLTLTLSSGQSLMGYTAQNGVSYFLMRENLGSSVNVIRLYKLDSLYGALNQICQRADDGLVSGGLYLNETTFFTLKTGYTSTKVLELSLATCQILSTTPIDTPSLVDASYMSVRSSFNFGLLNSAPLYLTSNSAYSQYNPTTHLSSVFDFDSAFTNATFLAATMGSNAPYSWTKGASSIWVIRQSTVSTDYGSTDLVWQLDLNLNPVNWAEVPVDDALTLGTTWGNSSSQGADTFAIGELDINTLAIVSVRSEKITLHYFDIKEF